MTRTVTGACFCGAVRFEADLPADAVGHCHCRDCQRAHGGPFHTYAIFAPERFRLVAGADALTSYVSEVGSTRRFCSRCGSTLLYESPQWPGVTVTVSNLLDPLDRAPEAHYYADRAPDWSPILDDLPRFGGPSGVEPLG